MSTVANGLQNALIYKWEYADAAARAAATGFVAADVGTLARQLDDNSLWLLTATTPTWAAISTAGGGTDPGALQKTANLSDVASASTSRTNLGLGTAATANTGTGSSNVILGNDSRLTDSRTPTAHHTTHSTGGTDAMAPADIGAAAASHTHTHSDVTDWNEAVDDRVAALLVAGTNVTLTYNDAANTLTVDSTGGGGGGSALTVDEVDGTPSDAATTHLTFPNGTLTDSAGHVTYTPAVGAGANTFTSTQTIAPATDVPAVTLDVPALGGLGYTSAIMRVRDDTGATVFTIGRYGQFWTNSDMAATSMSADTYYDSAGGLEWAHVDTGTSIATLFLPTDLPEQAAPASPASGKVRVYGGTDHKLHVKDSTGTDTALGSGGGGGNTAYTNAYSSPPSSPSDGDQWYPSDGVGVHFIRSGGAWLPYYAGYPLIDPTTPSWSWVNQGSATVATSGGGLFLQGASVSGENWQVRAVSAPSRPYTRTAAILPRFDTGGYEIGIGFRESGTGRLHMFFVYASGGDVVLYSSLFSSATNWSGTHYTSATVRWLGMQPLWLQISDDNTNRICRYSMDGQHWKAFHTVTRLDYLTGGADQLVWGVNANNTAPAATLISWG